MGCEEKSLEERMFLLKALLMAMSDDVRCVAIKGKDGWFSGSIDCVPRNCRNGRASCSLLKSAEIFTSDTDAIAWAREEVERVRKSTTSRERAQILFFALMARAEAGR